MNNVTCIQTDNVATNGVVHTIDEVLIPDSVKSVGEIAGEKGINQFLVYAHLAGFGGVLNGTDAGQFTIFAPSDAAFASKNIIRI